MSFFKGLAHLLLIWFAIVSVLCGAALIMATFDLMGDVGRAVQTHHYKDAT